MEKPPLVNLGLVSMPPSSDSSPLSSLGRSICLNRIVRRKTQSCFRLTLTSYSVKSLSANGFMSAQAKGGFVVQEEKWQKTNLFITALKSARRREGFFTILVCQSLYYCKKWNDEFYRLKTNLLIVVFHRLGKERCIEWEIVHWRSSRKVRL